MSNIYLNVRREVDGFSIVYKDEDQTAKLLKIKYIVEGMPIHSYWFENALKSRIFDITIDLNRKFKGMRITNLIIADMKEYIHERIKY